MSDIRVVLASQSPRRKEILELAQIEFEICPSDIEEIQTSDKPEEVCVELCKQKALDVASKIRAYNDSHPDITTPQDILVIGADTIVSFDGMILGKPKDEEDAVRMLCKLSGAVNEVFTGVSLVFMSREGRVGEHTFYERTSVTFNDIPQDEIKKYVESGEPMDKAGSYGIQGYLAKYISKIDGDYYNVMGLPLARIIKELNSLGVNL